MLLACKYEEIWAPEVQYSSLFNAILPWYFVLF